MMSNPLSLDTYFDIDNIAEAIVRLWRTGHRHPLLGRHVQTSFPGLPLPTFNEAADIAWHSLTLEERQTAAEEASC